jgi:hypothetical protein
MLGSALLRPDSTAYSFHSSEAGSHVAVPQTAPSQVWLPHRASASGCLRSYLRALTGIPVSERWTDLKLIPMKTSTTSSYTKPLISPSCSSTGCERSSIPGCHSCSPLFSSHSMYDVEYRWHWRCTHKLLVGAAWAIVTQISFKIGRVSPDTVCRSHSVDRFISGKPPVIHKKGCLWAGVLCPDVQYQNRSNEQQCHCQDRHWTHWNASTVTSIETPRRATNPCSSVSVPGFSSWSISTRSGSSTHTSCTSSFGHFANFCFSLYHRDCTLYVLRLDTRVWVTDLLDLKTSEQLQYTALANLHTFQITKA